MGDTVAGIGIHDGVTRDLLVGEPNFHDLEPDRAILEAHRRATRGCLNRLLRFRPCSCPTSSGLRLPRLECTSLPGVDVATLGGSAALLAVAMLTASILPARRASRLDPNAVLRQE